MRLMANEPQLQFSGSALTMAKQVADVSRNAVRNTHAQLDQRRCGKKAFLDHLFDERKVARVENLEFGLDLQIPRNRGALAQVVGVETLAPIPHRKQAPAIKGGDIGSIQAFMTQVDDVTHPVLLAHEIAAWRRHVLQPCSPMTM